MIGLGIAKRQVRDGRTSVWKNRNHPEAKSDAGASAGETEPNSLGEETSGAKRFLEGSPEEKSTRR